MIDGTPTATDSGDRSYLGIRPRTPYNRYVLPMMSISVTLERDGKTVLDGPLRETIDPSCNHHSGVRVGGVETGDELTIEGGAPPQVSRHEGYETAFVDMPAISLTLERGETEPETDGDSPQAGVSMGGAPGRDPSVSREIFRRITTEIPGAVSERAGV